MKLTYPLIFLVSLLGIFVRADNKEIMTNSKNSKESSAHQFALLGGGYFWCTEAVFEKLDGVVEVISGYAGGNLINPSYKDICTGKTGHAEVIKIKYLPEKISFSKLLSIFGDAHDPTTLNRQGADVGTQYRSTIMYYNTEQQELAQSWKENLSKNWKILLLQKLFQFQNFTLLKITTRIITRKIPTKDIVHLSFGQN